MGLGIVELVMEIEEAFGGLPIPDEDADKIRTQRDVVEYLARLLPLSCGPCGSQRAFYRLRQAIRESGMARGVAIRPGTSWDRVLPANRPREVFKWLRTYTGTRLPVPGPGATVGDTAILARDLYPERLFDPGQGWNRDRIAAVVNGCIRKVFPGRPFTADTPLVHLE